jgi:hypothetical protein
MREGGRASIRVVTRQSILAIAATIRVLLAATIVTFGGMMSAASTDRAHAAAAKPIRWLFHWPGVAAIATDPEASHVVENTRPFVIMRSNGFLIPSNWNAIPIVSFQSFSAITNALERSTLAPAVKGIMYDYEKWRFTPEEEQRNPAGYVERAADLVHAHGLLFLTAPAVNLVTIQAPEGRNQLLDTYLRLGIAADAARYADVIDIQAQRAEANTEVYANFVRQAAGQARQANPKVLVFAGVSTNPIGQHVTADDILRAISATRDIVDGYWLNIPAKNEYSPLTTDYRPDIAIEVLRRLGER